jgi:hypothetical protein
VVWGEWRVYECRLLDLEMTVTAQQPLKTAWTKCQGTQCLSFAGCSMGVKRGHGAKWAPE